MPLIEQKNQNYAHSARRRLINEHDTCASCVLLAWSLFNSLTSSMPKALNIKCACVGSLTVYRRSNLASNQRKRSLFLEPFQTRRETGASTITGRAHLPTLLSLLHLSLSNWLLVHTPQLKSGAHGSKIFMKIISRNDFYTNHCAEI